MSNTRVVILAAGKGTRMKSDIPKPLIPVAGEPMITRLVRSVKASGIDEKPVVVVGSWSEAMFRDVLRDSVEYAVQIEQLGTGHALMAAKDAVGDAERVIVLNGDHPFVSAPSIQALERMANEHGDAVVLLTALVPNFEGDYSAFIKWGRILRDEKNRVIAIREAKEASADELAVCEVNPNMYALPSQWAWENLAKINNQNIAGEYYITDLVAVAMQQEKEIVTSPAGSRDVIGINSPEELLRAEAMNADTMGDV